MKDDCPKFVARVRQTGIALVALTLAVGAQAAIYVDVPGIAGESVDKDHPGQIDALGAGGAFTQGRCGKYVVTKRLDKATPALIAATVSGQTFPEIVIEQTASYVDSGRVPVSTTTLISAKITRVETNMNVDEPVVELLKIKPTSIDLTYNEYDSRGGLKSSLSESVICSK